MLYELKWGLAVPGRRGGAGRGPPPGALREPGREVARLIPPIVPDADGLQAAIGRLEESQLRSVHEHIARHYQLDLRHIVRTELERLAADQRRGTGE